MTDITLDLWDYIESQPATHVENGLAVANHAMDYLDAEGFFKTFYSRDDGVYNSPQLPGSDYQAFKRIPGKYTGKMRQVVQLLMSRGRPISWDYHSYRSHGIYMDSDVHYVVEITASGVFIELLPILAETDPDHAFFGVTPAYSDSPIDRVQIATSEAMSDFYDNSTFFISCGWAFNDDGSKAVNTCYSVDPDTDLYHAYLFELSISKTAVSLALIEEGDFLFGKSFGFKIPDALEEKIEHFNCNPNPATTIGDAECTIYAWYKNDSLIKVKSKATVGEVNNFSDVFPDPIIAGCSAHYYRSTNDFGTYRQGTENKQPTKQCYIESHGFVDGDVAWTGTVRTCSGGGGGGLVYLGNRWYTDDSITETASYEYHSNGQVLTRQTVIIPLFDREAAYQIEHEYTFADQYAWANGTLSLMNSYGLRGQAWQIQDENDPNYLCYRISRVAQKSGELYIPAGAFYSGSIAVDAIIRCPGDYTAPINECNEGNEQGIEHNAFKISVICEGSGGVDVIYQDDTTTVLNEYFNSEIEFQAMASYPDSVNGNCYCSDKMDGLSGADYHTTGSIDFNLYPISTLSGWINCWVGKP